MDAGFTLPDNSDKSYQNCRDEEQFYLADRYGLWQWKHYKNGELAKASLMPDGRPNAMLPCPESSR